MSAERLPLELVLTEDGHLSEVGAMALGDGQDDVVPMAARDHAAACPVCSARVADHALLTLAVGDVLAAASVHQIAAAPSMSAPEARTMAATPQFPVAAVAGALVMAMAGMAPALAGAPARLTAGVQSAFRLAPVFVRGAWLFVSRAGGSGTVPVVAPGAAALVLLVFGVWLTRRMPRRALQGARS